MLFDGSNVWVLNNSLHKLRISDGIVLASYPAGIGPLNFVFDGQHIWVRGSNILSFPFGSVSKIRPADGVILASYRTAGGGQSIAVAGGFVWVANLGLGLFRLNPDTGAEIPIELYAHSNDRMTAGAHYVWQSGYIEMGLIARRRLSDGVLVGHFTVPQTVESLLFDGVNLWATHPLTDRVTKQTLADSTAVNITTNPTNGVTLIVDGTPFQSRYYWQPESNHTLTAPSPQGTGNTRYIFDRWDDNGLPTHTITVPHGNTSYTAYFRKQHRLTISTFPPAAGTVNVSPASGDGFHDDSVVVQLIPVAIAGAQFQSWSGDATGNANPLSVTMSAARNIIANFVPTSPCTFTLAANSASIPATGGASTVNVTPSNAACTFTASSPVDWVTVTASTTSAAYIAQPNPTPTARSATLTIAGRSFTIQQAAADCGVSINPSIATVPAAGGTLTINVTATSSNCTWTSSSPDSWVTITAGAIGTGNGVVTAHVQPNMSPIPRGTNLLIAGNGFNITQSASSTTNLRFVPLTPCRLLETRPEYNFEGRTGDFGPPYMKAGETRTLAPGTSRVCNVPTFARAYVLNITLVPRSSVDFVTIYPAGPRPDFFSIRSPDGQIVANQAVVKSGDSILQIYSSHDTDVLIDISGYFLDRSASNENIVFYPLTPCRVIETRAAYRTPAGPFGPPTMSKGETRRFRFPNSPHCAIPAGAAAYSATLTAVPPQPLPYMTAWAAGSAQPNVSSINSFAGRTLANNIIVPAGANGEIDIYAFDRTDFIADINGYFAPDNGQGLYYTPVTQCRASDAEYAKDQTRTIAIPTAGNCTGIPATAKGYVIDATAIPNGAPMPFLTLYPTGQPRPNASVLNAFEGQTVTNTSIIPAGTNGAIDVYAFERTRVVVDVSGYFSR